MSLQSTLHSINTGGFPKSLGDEKVFSSLKCGVFRCHCLQMLLRHCHCLNGAPASKDTINRLSPLEVQQLPALFPEARSCAVFKETARSIQSSRLMVFLKQAAGCGPLPLPSLSGALRSAPQWGVSGPLRTHPHSPPRPHLQHPPHHTHVHNAVSSPTLSSHCRWTEFGEPDKCHFPLYLQTGKWWLIKDPLQGTYFIHEAEVILSLLVPPCSESIEDSIIFIS